MRSSIVGDLSKFYVDQGISVADFHCRYAELCKQDASRPLRHGIEAHVGSHYGEVTRIVVLSLDPGGGEEGINKAGNIEGRTHEIQGVTLDSANPHMRGTYKFLRAMLKNEIPQDASPLPYYSMLNSAKCTGGDGKADMVPHNLHQRCQEYASGEFLILKPQIIWLQGRTLQNVYRGWLSEIDDLRSDIQLWLSSILDGNSELVNWMFGIGREYIKQISYGDQKSLAIATVHPSDRYGKWALFERTVMPIVASMAVGLAKI